MHLIKEIPEYKKLLSSLEREKRELKKQKRVVSSFKRKIEKLNSKYLFTEKILYSSGIELEQYVCQLFQFIGYKNIRHITHDMQNPDIEIEQNGELTCIEVKASQKQYLPENEIFQVLKYRNRRRNDLPNAKVKGLLVFNHENKISN